MSKKILIIGGGIAGMYLTERLSTSECDVTMLESSTKLGGRCTSFVDNTTNEIIDNGQHLLMGAYTHFLQFVDRIGASDKIGIFPKLMIQFYSTKGDSYQLTDDNNLLGGIGGKIGLLIALFATNHFSLFEKFKFIKLMLKVMLLNPKKISGTVATFLRDNNQSDKLIKEFWAPLVLAVMNTTPNIAPAKLLITVLKKSFLGSVQASKMMYSNTDYNSLFSNFQHLMTERKVNVKLNSRVNRILIQNGKAIGAELESGEILRADYIISAVPYFALQNILTADILTMPNFKNLIFYKNSPILSAYLWYKDEIQTPPMFAMLDSSIQWVFNRRMMQKAEYTNPEYKSCFAITISSSEENNALSKYELIENFADELSQALPQFQNQIPVHYRIIKEKRATFEANTEIENYRVNQFTDIENFYLCGDWTNTNLPATIEGACLSAEIVYEAISNKEF